MDQNYDFLKKGPKRGDTIMERMTSEGAVFSKELRTSYCNITESESLDPSVDFFA